ncbi:MAG: hypothetical protein JSS34_02765 [Proteobacteria bacterium]|nr:hypothetical protein [Pseudomonadota bacterium]
MDKKTSFLALLAASSFMFSMAQAVKVEIEADLRLDVTQRIRQRQPGDTSAYWERNEGRYTINWPGEIKSVFSLKSQDEYNSTTHRLTIKGSLEDLSKDFPTGAIRFSVHTVPYDVGKSEYNPSYFYRFTFTLNMQDLLSSEKDLKISLQPFSIMYKPPSSGSLSGSGWGPQEYPVFQLKPTVSPFTIETVNP